MKDIKLLSIFAQQNNSEALISAGYSASALDEFESIPVLIKPYSKMWADIGAGKIKHDQSTFCQGGDGDGNANVCGTAMCTAGHLVMMAGEIGWKLKEKYDWSYAAKLIHYRAHPDYPCQNFGSINQEWALAYIEDMANREAAETI